MNANFCFQMLSFLWRLVCLQIFLLHFTLFLAARGAPCELVWMAKANKQLFEYARQSISITSLFHLTPPRSVRPSLTLILIGSVSLPDDPPPIFRQLVGWSVGRSGCLTSFAKMAWSYTSMPYRNTSFLRHTYSMRKYYVLYVCTFLHNYYYS